MSLRWSVHWLLMAMPVSAVLDTIGTGAPIVFFCAAPERLALEFSRVEIGALLLAFYVYLTPP